MTALSPDNLITAFRRARCSFENAARRWRNVRRPDLRTISFLSRWRSNWGRLSANVAASPDAWRREVYGIPDPKEREMALFEKS